MRRLAWLWLACAALLLAATAARFYPNPPIETDLLALLPATERNPLAEQAAARLGRLTGERAVFLVGAPDLDRARAAAARLAQGMADGKTFKSVVTRVPSPDPAALLDLYTPYRMGLLPSGQALDPAVLTGKIEARLANPFGAGGALTLADDPFGLFDGWLQSLPYRQFRLDLEDGWLVARGEGMTWVLVSAELAGSAFDPAVQDGLRLRLNRAEADLTRQWPDVRILRAGAIFHALAARQSAQREIDVIGVGSLAGIVLLLLLVYRSPGPLFSGLLSVGVGLCAAALVTTWVFGRIHLMTLVFGASLIGEAIDYAIQYFSARLGTGPDWQPRRGLMAVLPALAVALATSVVGYTALAFTPFPAMRQIAVFAISGLAAAWLTVILVLPWALARPQTWQPDHLLALPGRLLRGWRARIGPRALLAIALPALAVSATGWMRLQIDDNVRQLIQSPADLTAQEQRLRALTGMEAGSQFFLIEGATAEDVLRSEEALTAELAGRGIGLQGVSRFVPSCQRQAEDRQRLNAALPAMAGALDQAGFRPEAVAAWSSQVTHASGCLAPQSWLATPISAPFRHLWLGQTGAGTAAVALPSGYRQVAELAEAARGIPGVTLVDKPGSVSRLFAEYRRLGAYVLAAATLLVLAVLSWRYGRRAGLAVLAPTLLAQALALGLLGHLGIAFNLFNLLALLLVLGVGVNYAIFLYEGARGTDAREAAALVGVILSALTTLLSFGLLGLSAMPALAGFGITLALGIAISVLLAPSVLILAGRRD
ncbi:MAG TPA: MMPL family transporter [Burkholderiaceae bacterium]|nr:MMPL family transporter [Burkholderiaceae bacterium]